MKLASVVLAWLKSASASGNPPALSAAKPRLTYTLRLRSLSVPRSLRSPLRAAMTSVGGPTSGVLQAFMRKPASVGAAELESCWSKTLSMPSEDDVASGIFSDESHIVGSGSGEPGVGRGPAV